MRATKPGAAIEDLRYGFFSYFQGQQSIINGAPPNCDYTTGRPYIEACEFATQTLSYKQVTSIGTSRSTPELSPPHHLADTDRFSSAAVCISGHANSSRNSFNARGLCAPAPLDQHRKILHPLACPLRLFSQGPQTQTAHDGNENRSLFDPLGHHRRVRFDSKPGLQRHPLLLPRCPQTRTRASGFPPRQTPGHHPPMSHPNRSTPPADHSVRHLSLPNPAHRPPPVRLWTASV